DDIRQVLEAAALPQMKSGAILIDHTTSSAHLAEDLARQAQSRNIRFIDAPVSGGQAGAENGQLTIMCGGDPQVFAQLNETLFPAYAQSAIYMGKSGQGQRAKMVNQICIAGVLRGLSEGLLLAQKAELDIPTLVSCLKNGAAGSWQMENRAQTMCQGPEGKYDFGFAIEWMIKDLGYALDEAEHYGLDLRHGRQTWEEYRKLAAEGYQCEDTSALLRAVRAQSESAR
ncbi:MAG: NAD(P)-dependent oxidoreductase, partial [Spirochaetota bacterium]